MRYLWIALYLLIFTLLICILVGAKVHPYQNEFSSLIGLWEGFAEINPGIVEPGFVIYKEGGYDGQFFYFLAKSMFSDLDWELIVDSYFFRLHRIGFTFFVGFPAALLGFTHYPIIAFLLPMAIFLLSVTCLYDLLPESKKWLSLFYLFSPYSLNSHLLLVADGFFTSLIVIVIFLIHRKSNAAAILFLLTFAIFTREIGIFLAVPIIIFYISNKNPRLTLAYSLPALFFLGFLIWTRSVSPAHLGTNPLGFGDMIDYPLFGFFKSFFDGGIFHLSLKESVKILLFLQWIALSIFSVRFFYSESRNQIIGTHLSQSILLYLLPILASLGIIFIAEEGYWRSFDNLSRMFTLSLPLAILLGAKKDSLYLIFFRYSSFALFIFLIFRIVFITKAKGYYLSP